MDDVRIGEILEPGSESEFKKRSERVKNGFWKAARRAVRADELTWNMALQDARVMADLSRAMSATAGQR